MKLGPCVPGALKCISNKKVLLKSYRKRHRKKKKLSHLQKNSLVIQVQPKGRWTLYLRKNTGRSSEDELFEDETVIDWIKGTLP